MLHSRFTVAGEMQRAEGNPQVDRSFWRGQ
jgi:hypothetical protein